MDKLANSRPFSASLHKGTTPQPPARALNINEPQPPQALMNVRPQAQPYPPVYRPRNSTSPAALPAGHSHAAPATHSHVHPVQPQTAHLRPLSSQPRVLLRKIAQLAKPLLRQAPFTGSIMPRVIQRLMVGSYVEVDHGAARWFGEIVRIGTSGVHEVRVGGTTDHIVPVAAGRITDTNILYFPADIRICIDKGKERAMLVPGSIHDLHEARFRSAYETNLLPSGSISSKFKQRTQHGVYENIPSQMGHFVISNTYASPEEEQRPSPGVPLSEIAYRQIIRSADEIRYHWDASLRWIWSKVINVSHIANPTAREVIKYIRARILMGRSSVQQEMVRGYPGFKCRRLQWEFYALLGTPSCTAPAMLVKDHGTDLGISRITEIECEFRGMLWIHYA